MLPRNLLACFSLLAQCRRSSQSVRGIVSYLEQLAFVCHVHLHTLTYGMPANEVSVPKRTYPIAMVSVFGIEWNQTKSNHITCQPEPATKPSYQPTDLSAYPSNYPATPATKPNCRPSDQLTKANPIEALYPSYANNAHFLLRHVFHLTLASCLDSYAALYI